MIASFGDKATEKLRSGGRVPKFQDFREQAIKRLIVLEEAVYLEDFLAVPGYRFEALSGDREGQFSIRINRKWRVCFRWQETPNTSDNRRLGRPYDVTICNYH